MRETEQMPRCLHAYSANAAAECMSVKSTYAIDARLYLSCLLFDMLSLYLRVEAGWLWGKERLYEEEDEGGNVS